YLAALERGRPGIYNCASDQVRLRDIVAAIAQTATGQKPVYLPVAEARARMGPLADALALSQRISSEKARNELDWTARGGSIFEAIALAANAETKR
ncbi:MAG: NAD(P)-dependent oxidoreductase, partial [Candidatus Eremiobacteraeota bacterium]|nr:NAD(P)-dependent oxidoreductase [Candidatus Eremiobacteraeota bacterium]